MIRKISKFRKSIRKILHLLSGNVNLYSSKFSKKTYNQHQLIVLNCLKTQLNLGYEKFTELLTEMKGIQEELKLKSIPHYTTLQKACMRLNSKIFNLLITLSAQLTPSTGNAAIDATGFERGAVSHHYSKRCKIEPKSQKTTFITDTGNKTILGVHMTTGRKHDARIAPILVSRVLRDFLLNLLFGDKGYDSMKFRKWLGYKGIFPIIKYRIFYPTDYLLNETMDDFGYSKRSVIESVNSSIKRKFGDRLRSRKWFTQFKETKLKVIVYNIEIAVCAFLLFGVLITR